MTDGIFPKLGGSLITDKTKPYSPCFDSLKRLAQRLHPRTVLLAGLEAAVWADFPLRHRKVGRNTPGRFGDVSGRLGGTHGSDVTG